MKRDKSQEQQAREHARNFSRDKSREIDKSTSKLDRSIDNVKGKMEAYKSKSPMRGADNSYSSYSRSPMRKSKSPIRP